MGWLEDGAGGSGMRFGWLEDGAEGCDKGWDSWRMELVDVVRGGLAGGWSWGMW